MKRNNIPGITLVATAAWLLAGCGMPSSPVQWFEAEDVFTIPENIGKGTGTKAPASGGRVTEGGIVGEPGRTSTATVTLPAAQPDAKLVFRYARFHWNDRMVPAQIDCEVTAGGTTTKKRLVFGDTGGWGASLGSEWNLREAAVGDLPKGPVTVTITSASEISDVVLDGFFIAPAARKFTASEFTGLQRLAITDRNYVGIELGGSAINQHTHDGFRVAVRGFADGKMRLTLKLLNTDGTTAHEFVNACCLLLKDTPSYLDVSKETMAQLKDGRYTLKAEWDKGAGSLEMPFTVVGDLARKSTEQEKVITGYLPDLKGSQLTTVKDDFRYMGEYIRRVLTVLAYRSGDDVDTAALAGAKKYFWKNGQFRKTPAWKFVGNLQAIITQSDAVIANIKKGVPPYQGVTGTVRRAFVSKATGKLEEYQFYLPKSYKADGNAPLLLRLAGNENMFQDTDNGVSLDLLEKTGYVLVAPKANDSYWDDGLKNLVQLITVMLKEYPGIDKKKVFCHGASAGGFGTFNLAARHPDLIAGIGCINGTVRKPIGKYVEWGAETKKLIPNLNGTKVYVAQGKLDRLVTIEHAEFFIQELKRLGIPYRYRIHDEMGHHLETSLYMEDMLEYLSKQPDS